MQSELAVLDMAALPLGRLAVRDYHGRAIAPEGSWARVGVTDHQPTWGIGDLFDHVTCAPSGTPVPLWILEKQPSWTDAREYPGHVHD